MEVLTLYYIFKVSQQGQETVMNIWDCEMEVETKDVFKIIKTKKFSVDWELASELYEDYFKIWLTGPNSRDYDIIHLDNKFAVVSRTFFIE